MSWGYVNAILILGGINVIAALGVSILTGYTGLFSIGHAGFMALGGYTSALLVLKLNMPFVPALLIGATVAGLSSLLIGYPTFRGQLRGDYFAIATLGFAESIRLVLNNAYEIPGFKIGGLEVPPLEIGGAFGLMGIPAKTTTPVILVAVLLALYFAHMFVTSQHGKNCIAVAQDETAAQMMGVNLLRTKLTALFISAFYAGIAGGLLAFYMAYLSPSFFNFDRSSGLLAAVVFGGIQSLIGPFITAFVLIAVPEMLRTFAEWRLIIYGLLFVIVMLFRPQGLLGYVQMNMNFARRWWASLTNGGSRAAASGKGNL
ncbi:MAG: branched-chain amino acid ABC transporter permease [Chloroflexota bacterium]